MNEDGNVCVNEDQDSTIQYMCGGLCVCVRIWGVPSQCVSRMRSIFPKKDGS